MGGLVYSFATKDDLVHVALEREMARFLIPSGIAVDSSRNMYVMNPGSQVGGADSITVYPAGSNGNATPSATISGASTALDFPLGIAVDSGKNIYVTNDREARDSYEDKRRRRFSTGAAFCSGNVSERSSLLAERNARSGAVLNLEGASVGVLFYDPHSWPAPGKLILDGSSYKRLPDTRSRLHWLALQPEYHPQPYRQLAKVLREQGDEEGAIAVLVTSQDLRYASYGRASALWGGFLNATIGYGHRPLRTIGWSLFVILIGGHVVFLSDFSQIE